MTKKQNPVDVLIQNIRTDVALLEEKNTLLEDAKTETREIVSRIKDYKKDLSHMLKYLSDEQRAEIEKLDLNISEQSSGKGELNPFSQIALDALMKAKGNRMTNNDLYVAYVDTMSPEKEAVTYTQFNIKIRQLFKSGKISKKQLDEQKPSRDDIIALAVKAE